MMLLLLIPLVLLAFVAVLSLTDGLERHADRVVLRARDGKPSSAAVPPG